MSLVFPRFMFGNVSEQLASLQFHTCFANCFKKLSICKLFYNYMVNMDELVKVGRPRKNPSELRSKNDARADLIRQARFSDNVSRSLQPCAVKDNRRVLEKLLQETSSQKRKKKIQGLIAVFDLLKSNYVAEDGRSTTAVLWHLTKLWKSFWLFKTRHPHLLTQTRIS